MKILCWNVDQAKREEAVPETKWDVRSEQVKKLIGGNEAECEYDLIALVELRDLPTSKETTKEFMAHPVFKKFDVVYRRYCHYNDAFQMALFFDPTLFFVGTVTVVNYDDTPENDKMVMLVELQSKLTKKWFVFGVTHFAMDEAMKTRACYKLRRTMEVASLPSGYPFHKKPIFVYGDFNFFDDKDGPNQRKHMLEKFTDLAFPLMMTAEEDATPLNGTFLGFPHDAFKKPIDKMSRLDHIFASEGVKLKSPAFSPFLETYNLDNSSYSTFDYPSDHLAIELEVDIDA